MAKNPADPDFQQARRMQDWWLRLPLSYRVNALLYFLGACALVFLFTTILSGGGNSGGVQVGAGITTPTTAGTRATATGPTSSQPASTSSSGPTTTGSSSTTVKGATTTTRAGTETTGATVGPGPTTSTTKGVPATVGTTTPPPSSTTTTTQPCRNSTLPVCGPFHWDPTPNNQPIGVGIVASPASPHTGDQVTFTVTVTDPDHTVGTCATMDFGDQTPLQGSCPSPPCAARYGAWDLPPAGVANTHTFTYMHTYAVAQSYFPSFYVDDRNDCQDPYGAAKTQQSAIVVGPASG
jgi:hypothetical protein